MPPKKNRLILVSGNQSGDMDSIVCSFVKMNLLLLKKEPSTEVICFLNFPRSELILRAEVVFLFRNQRLDLTKLCFRDELESLALDDYARNDCLGIVLVDHNEPEKELQPYARFVCEIIDHHKDLSPDNSHLTKTILPTGSCATLVGQQFLDLIKAQPKILNVEVTTKLANILYATIRIDSDHLTGNSSYDLERDRKIIKSLRSYINVDDSFLSHLKEVKSDVSRFTINNHLTKDFKSWICKNISYGISSVYLEIEQLVRSKEDYHEEIRKFLENKKIDILFLMHLVKKPIFKRELTVTFSDSFLYRDEILMALSDSELFKEIKRTDTEESLFTFYSQLKPEYSRKMIQPYIEKKLKDLKDK